VRRIAQFTSTLPNLSIAASAFIFVADIAEPFCSMEQPVTLPTKHL
jgi:hypothetical protein